MLLAGSLTLLMLFIEYNSDSSGAIRIFGVAVGALGGFRLPDYILARRARKRSVKLRKALPDALDLMVVCAEAGLTIDRSFRIVSEHLGHMHPEICEEFGTFSAEITAGLRRKEALENLVLRTQEPEVQNFIAVLTQADRFGTSMGDALRTHADYLRTRRRQDAEEKAAKVGIKLIFPIFFFIMPCMMLVTVGPAFIGIAKHLGQLFGGE